MNIVLVVAGFSECRVSGGCIQLWLDSENIVSVVAGFSEYSVSGGWFQ